MLACSSRIGGEVRLTVSAWLDGSFNVANALNGNPVLVVPVHELVLQLADFKYQNPEFIRDIRDIIITSFAPN